MIYAIIIFIVWNWGLTPLWVNIVTTILAGLAILGELCDD